MSRLMNQTYFEYYEFDVNVVLILIATCTYKSMLYWVRMNQNSWISILLTHSCWKLHEYLWEAKKRFIADLWLISFCISTWSLMLLNDKNILTSSAYIKYITESPQVCLDYGLATSCVYITFRNWELQIIIKILSVWIGLEIQIMLHVEVM